MAEEKSSETLLCIANDISEANMVRSELLQTSHRLWLFVSKNLKGHYTIKATNEYGGRLPDAHIIVLREKCQKLVKNSLIDTEENETTTSDDNENTLEWSTG